MPIKSAGNPDLIKLKQYLDYKPETGIFIWRITRNWHAKAGTIAGSVHEGGYLTIRIEGKAYLSHRLAWFYVHGELHELDQIDHCNLNRKDNRLCNLRKADHKDNCRNTGARSHNKTGLKGVGYDKRRNKYRSRITINKKIIWLGEFNTAEEAHAAYCQAAEEYYGEFFRKE